MPGYRRSKDKGARLGARAGIAAALSLILLGAFLSFPRRALAAGQTEFDREKDRFESQYSETEKESRKALEELEKSVHRDLESMYRKLQKDVDQWTEDLGYESGSGVEFVNVKNLKQGISDAMQIAKENGLDVQKLTRIYEMTKKVIRDADFEIPDKPRLDRDDKLSTRIIKLFIFAFEYEKTIAEQRSRLMHYKLGLYKRATVAYIRALISSRNAPPPCNLKEKIPGTITVNGKEIPSVECPDPVVKNLRAYLKAIRTIQSADADALIAESEKLIAEQQLAADLMSVVPFVGDAMDIYAVYSGQDISGRCLSTLERALTGIMVAIPIVGPALLEQAIKRSPRVAEGVAKLGAFFEASMELGSEVMAAYREIGVDVSERLAKRWGTEVPALKKLHKMFKGWQLDDAVRAKMKVFRTMQEAAENRRWIMNMPEEVRERAVAESAEVMRKNLGAVQGPRTSRVGASNMVPEHVDALENLAKERGEIYIYRSVNPDSTKRIAENYATKGMNVKGKSADWGAHAAFIPVDQKLSKLGNPNLSKVDLEKIREFHEKVAKCLKARPPCAKSALLEVDGMAVMAVKDKAGRQITVFHDVKNGRYLDEARNPIRHGDIDTKGARQVEVLADDHGNPLTADYDFMNFGTKGQHESPVFKPDTGYITKKQEEILDATNEAVRKAGYEGGNVSHHGAEQWYPFSPGAMEDVGNPYLTVFDPEAGTMVINRCDSDCMKQWCRSTGNCNPGMICGPGQSSRCIPPDPNRLLKDYYHDKRLAGYNIGPNSVWGWGHYNGLGGWSFAEYLGSLNNRTAPSAAKSISSFSRQAAPRAGSAAVRSASVNVSKAVAKGAMPACRQEESHASGNGASR